MNKRSIRNVAAAATIALVLSGTVTACNNSKKSTKPASTSTTASAADPGKAIEELSSATQGEPSSIKPNAGAMALCDDGKIKTNKVNTVGNVLFTNVTPKTKSGEDCVVHVEFKAKKSMGMTMALATPRALHVSGLFAQPTFITGPKSFSDVNVPDDSTLAVLFQDSQRTAGMQVVTNKNEEPNSRAFQVANVPVYRQLVATK